MQNISARRSRVTVCKYSLIRNSIYLGNNKIRKKKTIKRYIRKKKSAIHDIGKLLNYNIKDWLELGTLTILDVCIGDKKQICYDLYLLWENSVIKKEKKNGIFARLQLDLE